MAQDKKRFSEDFTPWVGNLPAGIRLMIEHPVTGEEYWISREKFLEGYEAGNSSVHSGATAYEIYAAVTSDNPILSESDWIQSLYGQDGETPFVGPNGNWWTGTTDTGIRAQSTVITPTITISGIKKGMTIEWCDPDNIPTGFVLSDGNYKNNFAPINGINIPDKRGVTDRGYDPDSLPTPEHTDGTTENYGRVGNTGGEDSHTLTQDELPKIYFYIFANSNDPGNNTLPSNPEAPPVWSTNHQKGNQDYDIYAKLGVEASIGVTNTIGKGVEIPMRPKYRVACYITKISDDDQSTGENSFIDPVAGTNVSIDKTNASRPVISVDLSNYYTKQEIDDKLASFTNGEDGITPHIGENGNWFIGTTDTGVKAAGTNGSSTETAPYVLSGLDADIKTGVIDSHTILDKHQFTAADIYLEVTNYPETLGIVVDVLKNGVSIFSTKPTIATGALHSVGSHVLVTSPTVFDVGDIRSLSVLQMGVGEGKTGKNLKLSILMHKIN